MRLTFTSLGKPSSLLYSTINDEDDDAADNSRPWVTHASGPQAQHAGSASSSTSSLPRPSSSSPLTSSRGRKLREKRRDHVVCGHVIRPGRHYRREVIPSVVDRLSGRWSGGQYETSNHAVVDWSRRITASRRDAKCGRSSSHDYSIYAFLTSIADAWANIGWFLAPRTMQIIQCKFFQYVYMRLHVYKAALLEGVLKPRVSKN